jgi:26S proteasome regulatory subunit T6
MTISTYMHTKGIHSRRMNLMRGIDFMKIAEKMNNSSGAECKAICTEAGHKELLLYI